MHGPELQVVFILAVALALGAAMRAVSRKTKLPYTITMLVLGAAFGLLLPRTFGGAHDSMLMLIAHGSEISSDLILFVFLPALVFESAYSIELGDFKRNAGAVAFLAGPIVVLSTFMIAAAMVWITGASWQWSWPVALVFGALISATDPVAVVAIFRELGVSKRLAVLIEGESLLNDGTSIVVFTVLLAALTGEVTELDPGATLLSFVRVVAGGILLGVILSFALSAWIGRLFNDPLVEITLTLVLAYGAMVLAEAVLHVSGVMALVVSGLWMGSKGKTKVSPEVSHFLHGFWGLLGHIANTLIFFLVGLVVATHLDETRPRDLVVIGLSYLAVMAIRAVLTFGSQPITNRWSDGVSAKDSAIITWGGLRGAVPLALGLVVSRHPGVPSDVGRQVLLVTAGIVLLTILINGTTAGRLLAVFGYDKPPIGEELARLAARADVLDHVREEIDMLDRTRQLRTVVWTDVESQLDERRRALESEIGARLEQIAEAPRAERLGSYWRRAIAVERQAYWSLYADGILSSAAVQALAREVDRHVERIGRMDLDPVKSRLSAHASGLGKSIARYLGQAGGDFDAFAFEYDISNAESIAAGRTLAALGTMRDIPDAELAKIREMYESLRAEAVERLEDIRANLPEMAYAIETRLARRIELNLEREGYRSLARRGVLTDSVLDTLLESVERRMAQLLFTSERLPLPDTADIVRSMPLFDHFDSRALDLLAEITEEVVFQKGEDLLVEGEAGNNMMVIARGAVHVLERVGEEEVRIDVLGGGDIVGEISVLTGAARTATARAATTVTVGKIERDDFARLMASQPRFEEGVWREVCRRRFDNALRNHSSYAGLDHDARMLWFDRAEVRSIRKGASAPCPEGMQHVFVAVGRVRIGDRTVDAPAIAPIGGATSIVAAADARLSFLPDRPRLRSRGPRSRTELKA